MRFGLKESVIEQIGAVLARHPQVAKAILYGSRAKGNYRNGSDIDLTLDGCADLTQEVLYKIMDDIDELLLPYNFDLSVFSGIGDSDVIEHIRRAGIVFYEKQPASSLGGGKFMATSKEETSR